MRWFDAHLDLAYLAVNGRDMTAGLRAGSEVARTSGPGDLTHRRGATSAKAKARRSGLPGSLGPHSPATVTLPELRAAGVEACLGTIFTEAGGADASSYPEGDAEAAHARGLAQLDVYRAWAERGELVIHQPLAPSIPRSTLVAQPLRLIILMECADPIREPSELEWWVAGGRGVRAIGLAWARGSRYAAGNAEPSCSSGVGLSPAGRELVREMDRLGVTHDVSHLSDRAFGELMEIASGPIIASHSNCRALLGDANNQRHLTDAQIREVASRGGQAGGGGVIGLNLFGKFLVPSGQYLDRTGSSKGGGGGHGRRATLADAVAHIDHVCSLTGCTRHVGLGSDMDGGFSALDLPVEIERASHLIRLAEALHDRGWSDEDIHAFAWGNWARVWGV